MDLLWFDAETTGLDERRCTILEVSLFKADLMDPFNAQHVYSTVVSFPRSRWAEIPEKDREFVIDCHTKNGLLAECDAPDAPTLREVEDRLLQLVAPVAKRDDMPVLAGSSVHFDHAFLRVHMPDLASRLSHRHYDVSAIKLFAQSQGMPKFRKVEAHRARPDVEESIQHARECRQWLKTYLSGIDDGR